MPSNEIKFLTKANILFFHEQQIKEHGGKNGLRDTNSLESALAMPQQTYEGDYLHKDIFEMAAAYLYSLAKNHAFNDGNKRVASISCIYFLDINGYNLFLNNSDIEQLARDVVNNHKDKADVARILKAESYGPKSKFSF